MESDALPLSDAERALRDDLSSRGPPDFRTVYLTLYHPVANYLWRRTGDAHATEDLLGDVFLAVLRALPRFQRRGKPVRHWVFRIANHTVNRWARRRRTEHRAMQRRSQLAAPHHEPDSAPASRDAARAALAALPRRLREVAALHYLAGFSLEEVGATLALPLGTVKSRLSRARELVRARWPEAP
jgi:RNA polymerase sigma-70 factor (ECF subfamily)